MASPAFANVCDTCTVAYLMCLTSCWSSGREWGRPWRHDPLVTDIHLLSYKHFRFSMMRKKEGEVGDGKGEGEGSREGRKEGVTMVHSSSKAL